MENKFNRDGADRDFTGKGRIPESDNGNSDPDAADISGIDQQEGNLHHGTTGGVQHQEENPQRGDDAKEG